MLGKSELIEVTIRLSGRTETTGRDNCCSLTARVAGVLKRAASGDASPTVLLLVCGSEHGRPFLVHRSHFC